MQTTTSRLRRLLAGTTACVALLGVAACTDEDEGGAPAASNVSLPTRDLGAYDAFVLASAENNPLFADVYGVTFEPFSIDRVTTGKRISSLGADESHVVVAAADTDVDRLAVVTGAGDLQSVPGLGRPFAYNPTIVDGLMYYEDFTEKSDGSNINRYFAWDLDKREKSLLFRYAEQLDGMTPAGRGRFVFLGEREVDDRVEALIVTRDRSGKLSKFPLGRDVAGLKVGARWIATTLVGEDSRFGDQPDTMVFYSPEGGTKFGPGLQAICWTPDGTRMLARRTDKPTASELILVDPENTLAQVEVGTVPDLVIYSGTWVRGKVNS